MNLEPEEENDVEGHVDLRTDVGAVDAARADEDDDVEAHVDLNAVDLNAVDINNVDV